MDYIYILDLVGTLVFAMSGALAADEYHLDFFGASVIAFVTAVGGGTIRDVLIGSTPVGWMEDLNYLYCIGFGVLVAWFFKTWVRKLRRTLFLFDTIGIGIFTVLGLTKTLGLGLAPIVALLMGMVSAVFGGVLRDTLTNEIPLIFRKEIYATACLSGGLVFLLVQWAGLPTQWCFLLGASTTIVLRVLAVLRGWTLRK
ncbi:MAG: trimeric intracellular cation channel family protein [Bacteroidota bacterium]